MRTAAPASTMIPTTMTSSVHRATRIGLLSRRSRILRSLALAHYGWSTLTPGRFHFLHGRQATAAARIAERPGKSPQLRIFGVIYLSRDLAVYNPRRAERIDEHTETGGPEGLLKRHLYGAVFRKRAE